MSFVRIELNNYYAYNGAWHKAHSQQIVAIIFIISFNITPQASYHYCLYFTNKETRVWDHEYKSI